MHVTHTQTSQHTQASTQSHIYPHTYRGTHTQTHANTRTHTHTSVWMGWLLTSFLICHKGKALSTFSSRNVRSQRGHRLEGSWCISRRSHCSGPGSAGCTPRILGSPALALAWRSEDATDILAVYTARHHAEFWQECPAASAGGGFYRKASLSGSTWTFCSNWLEFLPSWAWAEVFWAGVTNLASRWFNVSVSNQCSNFPNHFVNFPTFYFEKCQSYKMVERTVQQTPIDRPPLFSFFKIDAQGFIIRYTSFLTIPDKSLLLFFVFVF